MMWIAVGNTEVPGKKGDQREKGSIGFKPPVKPQERQGPLQLPELLYTHI